MYLILSLIVFAGITKNVYTSNRALVDDDTLKANLNTQEIVQAQGFKNNNIERSPMYDMTDNPILHIHKFQNNDLIKRRLNNFAIVRKKTHFTVPSFLNLRTRNDNTNVHNNYFTEAPIDINKTEIVISPDTNIDDPFYDDPRIFTVMREQTKLIEKLLRVIEKKEEIKRNRKKKPRKNDFEELLNELDLKQNRSGDHVGDRITISTTTTKKPRMSTLLTMVDETEIRKALKNNPLVMRILKLAQRKRIQYLRKAMSMYYKNKN